MGAGLLELLDHLQLISGRALLVQQVDVLDAPIVKDKVVDVVVVNLAGLFNDALAGLVQPGFHKAQPFALGELNGVECLQLHTHVGQQGFGRVQTGEVFITLILQILNELSLQIAFALVALGNRPFPDVLVQDDEVL